MKRILSLLIVSSAWGQQTEVSGRFFDVNGRVMPGTSVIQSPGSRSRITRNLNGQIVPIESTEERIISDSANLKVIERVVRRYDPNGQSGPPERIRIEERKNPDGTTLTSTTVFRGDINGSFQLGERSTTLTRALTRASGVRVENTTTIERPTLNGSMELVERKEQSIVVSGDKTIDNASTFRRDMNGQFQETGRTTREAVTSNGRTTENTAEYQSITTGKMQIWRQSPARADDRGNREVTVYVPTVEGPLTVAEQQVIEKKDTPTGATETVTVRLALPNDPGKLGPARKVEEIVCTGACGRVPQP